MGRPKKITCDKPERSVDIFPALTPEAKENELIDLATRLAEMQLRNGTASAQVISHYLKLGTTREKLEKERLAAEVELAKAKRDRINSEQRSEEMFVKAIAAMREYQGSHDE